MKLTSDRIENAFIIKGKTVNAGLLFRAMALASQSDTMCFCTKELRAFALALAPEYFSDMKAIKRFSIKEIEKAHACLVHFLSHASIMHVLHLFSEEIFIEDSSESSTLFYLYNKQLSDCLYKFGTRHPSRLTKSMVECRLDRI